MLCHHVMKIVRLLCDLSFISFPRLSLPHSHVLFCWIVKTSLDLKCWKKINPTKRRVSCLIGNLACHCHCIFSWIFTVKSCQYLDIVVYLYTRNCTTESSYCCDNTRHNTCQYKHASVFHTVTVVDALSLTWNPTHLLPVLVHAARLRAWCTQIPKTEY